MSQRGPLGRFTPLVRRGACGGPVPGSSGCAEFRAGLAGRSAIVRVGPPLSASGRSLAGSPMTLSGVGKKPLQPDELPARP
jgi:hypothetical protein